MLDAQPAIRNTVCLQLRNPDPGGPPPDWREAVAANISLFGSRVCLFGRVLTTDKLLNVGGTLGAIRRTAKDRYIIEIAVRDLRNLLPAKITVYESTHTDRRNSYARLRGARPVRI